MLELAWEGIPVAVVFVLAISAKALSICDVSGAEAPAAAAFPPVWFSGIKSFGGDPVGVVDRASTVNKKVSEA